MLRVFAPAKVNLCLHVTGQRADGYHLLDTVVAFADVGDVLDMQLGPDQTLSVIGPEAAGLADAMGVSMGGADNIITRVLAAFGGQGVRVTLHKNLPVASGIGGGSTDAAAAYRGVCALLGRSPLAQDAAKLLGIGADVPMCVAAVAARVQGIGERISNLPNLPPLYAVLVNPRVAVPTPIVFKALSKKENSGISDPPKQSSNAAELIEWLAQQRNDLAAPAQSIAPQITKVLASLSQSGAVLARMSGSGATCFGLYASTSDAARAAHDLQRARPDWWVAQTVLNSAINISPQAMRATT